MNVELAQKLNELIGKTVTYNRKTAIIKSWKKTGPSVVVLTDGSSIIFDVSNTEVVLSEIKIVSEEAKSISKASDKKHQVSNITINGYQPTAENDTIKQALLSALTKVQENPKENHQLVRSVCDIANSMVSIQKAEIQLINTVSKF